MNLRDAVEHAGVRPVVFVLGLFIDEGNLLVEHICVGVSNYLYDTSLMWNLWTSKFLLRNPGPLCICNAYWRGAVNPEQFRYNSAQTQYRVARVKSLYRREFS